MPSKSETAARPAWLRPLDAAEITGALRWNLDGILEQQWTVLVRHHTGVIDSYLAWHPVPRQEAVTNG